MSTQRDRTWPPVLGGLAVWAVVLVLSTFTSFVQRSPIHSDSWWPLLSTWALGLVVGLALLVARRWAWGAAWSIGTIGGVVTYVGGVVILVVTHGS